MSTKTPKKKEKKAKKAAIVVPTYLVKPMEAVVAPGAPEEAQVAALRVRAPRPHRRERSHTGPAGHLRQRAVPGGGQAAEHDALLRERAVRVRVRVCVAAAAARGSVRR